MPTASDLVTDLPADFETFGQAVATSMADLLGGTTGQVLSKASNTDMDFTWVTSDDSNAIQNTIVDAKGDLIGATAADTPARLAVGTNGQVLTADSTAATGLAWTTVSGSPTSYGFAAGKNKIINGDFGVWQRGTSFATSGAYQYTADRFVRYWDGTASVTVSRQTFTPGTAPVSGYEGAYFYRFLQSTAGTGMTYNAIAYQPIEDVRTFAGQTVTFSLWLKADAARTVSVQIEQNFGSGGSGAVNTVLGTPTLTTSWVRYTYTTTLASISGKTIGTNSQVNVRVEAPLNTAQTIDTWGWQLEAGSTATAFQTATGTIQGELAACQRYFFNYVNNTSQTIGVATFNAATQAETSVQFPSTMRTTPTLTSTTGSGYYGLRRVAQGSSSMLIFNASTTSAMLYAQGFSSLTAGQSDIFYSNNSAASLSFSAEL